MLWRTLIVAALAIVLVDPQAALAADPPAKQPTAVGRGGAAATVDALGTQAAIEALRHGGNAVDAAVAAAGRARRGRAVLVRHRRRRVHGHPHPRAARSPRSTRRERSPEPPCSPDSFFENGAAARVRRRALQRPLRRRPRAPSPAGTRRCAATAPCRSPQALRPAIRAARDGFLVDQTFVDQTEDNVDCFDDIPSTAALYLDPDGTPRDVGDDPPQPRPGAHLRAHRPPRRRRASTAAPSPTRWSTPCSTRRLAPDADHAWRPGLHDRARPARLRRARARADAGRATAASTSGAWDRPRAAARPSARRSTSSRAIRASPADRTRALHLFLEASRFSFADRNAYLADPDFFDVPLTGLLSDDFAAERRALIDPRTRPARSARRPAPVRRRAQAERATATRQSTTHLVVADREGTVVVLHLHDRVDRRQRRSSSPAAGFLLNNELTDFNFDSPTHPNSAEGGKRPRSSMSPTIVLADGEPLLALGSPGGSTIITTVLQVLLDRLDLGATLPDAIAAPRASQRNTATTAAEPAFVASPEGQALDARVRPRLSADGARSARSPASSSSAAAGCSRPPSRCAAAAAAPPSSSPRVPRRAATPRPRSDPRVGLGALERLLPRRAGSGGARRRPGRAEPVSLRQQPAQRPRSRGRPPSGRQAARPAGQLRPLLRRDGPSRPRSSTSSFTESPWRRVRSRDGRTGSAPASTSAIPTAACSSSSPTDEESDPPRCLATVAAAHRPPPPQAALALIGLFDHRPTRRPPASSCSTHTPAAPLDGRLPGRLAAARPRSRAARAARAAPTAEAPRRRPPPARRRTARRGRRRHRERTPPRRGLRDGRPLRPRPRRGRAFRCCGRRRAGRARALWRLRRRLCCARRTRPCQDRVAQPWTEEGTNADGSDRRGSITAGPVRERLREGDDGTSLGDPRTSISTRWRARYCIQTGG